MALAKINMGGRRCELYIGLTVDVEAQTYLFRMFRIMATSRANECLKQKKCQDDIFDIQVHSAPTRDIFP